MLFPLWFANGPAAKDYPLVLTAFLFNVATCIGTRTKLLFYCETLIERFLH